ncbi:MAG: GlcG/HbpS family heme-binding protein [Caulobacteraceae bacterium]
MSFLTLDQANAIIAGAVAKGRALGLKPLTVAVVDGGGHLIAFQRSDGSPTLRPAIAIGKAAGAVGLGVPSRKIGEMAVERPHFVAAIGHLAADGLIPVAGGVNVIDGEGRIIGAVGVSGDTSDNDEVCATAGIGAAGLRAQG